MGEEGEGGNSFLIRLDTIDGALRMCMRPNADPDPASAIEFRFLNSILVEVSGHKREFSQT